MADQPNLLRGFTIARMSRTGACDNAVVIRGCGLLVALHKQFCKHCFIVHPNRADFVDEGNIGKSIAHTTTKILDQCENPSEWISNQCILHSKWHKTPSHLSATRIFYTPPPPPPPPPHTHTHKHKGFTDRSKPTLPLSSLSPYNPITVPSSKIYSLQEMWSHLSKNMWYSTGYNGVRFTTNVQFYWWKSVHSTATKPTQLEFTLHFANTWGVLARLQYVMK